jgi:hypothetical protein
MPKKASALPKDFENFLDKNPDLGYEIYNDIGMKNR